MNSFCVTIYISLMLQIKQFQLCETTAYRLEIDILALFLYQSFQFSCSVARSIVPTSLRYFVSTSSSAFFSRSVHPLPKYANLLRRPSSLRSNTKSSQRGSRTMSKR